MGVLDEVPNLANQAQTWSNYWQNQNKWESERAAGQALANDNIDQAKKEAAVRGNLGLYSDLHTMQQQRQLEIGQKMLAVVQSAKTQNQYHSMIDLLTQHGVPGLSKYRVPPGGDFETTKNTALAELGTHTEYLKWQQEQLKAETERRKVNYRGIMTVPGAPRETPIGPMDLPREGGITPVTPVPTGESGKLVGRPTEGVEATGALTPTMSIGDISARLGTEMASRGLAPTTTKTGEPGPDRKFAYSTTEEGKPVLEELPEGAEFEGTGTKAKRSDYEISLERVNADPLNAGKSETERARLAADIVKTMKQKDSSDVQMTKIFADPQMAEAANKLYAAKKGPQKTTAVERAADRISSAYEASHNGEKMDPFQALTLAKQAIEKEPEGIQKLKMLMGPEHDKLLGVIEEDARAEGKIKQPETMQIARAIQDERRKMGADVPPISDAIREAVKITNKGPSTVALLNYLSGLPENQDKSIEEIQNQVVKLQRETGAERETRKIGEEEGLSTREAIRGRTEAMEKTPTSVKEIEDIKQAAREAGHPLTDDEARAKWAETKRATRPESADMQMMKYRSQNEAHANQVDAFMRAKGTKDKTSPMERNILHVQAEAEAAGRPISYTDAMRIVGSSLKAPSGTVSELQMLLGPDHDRVLKAIQERAQAQGKGQEPEGIKMAHAILDDARARGDTKMTIGDAYDLAKGHGAKESDSTQMLNDIREHNPGKPEAEVQRIFRELKTHISDTDRIKAETGLDTVGAIAAKESAVAKARAEGRTVPQIFQTTKDGVPGTLYVNPVTKEESFTPHPKGIGDVSKYAAKTNRMNAELDEIEKIRKENPGMSELDALTARHNAMINSKNPSAELQGINALKMQYPNENFEELTKRWVSLHEKKTDKDKQIAAIMDAHPGETKEDAYARQAALNKLTVLKKDPTTGEFKAIPIEGTIEKQKLDKPLKAGNESDLTKVVKALGNDPRYKDMPEVDRYNIAKSILNQKGYNVHIANDGNLAFQAAENSEADIKKKTEDLRERQLALRERVATDPLLSAQMTWARETAKYNVKTVGREAQTIVLDNHINGVVDLAGGADPKKAENPQKRRDLESAIGFLNAGLGLRIWRGEIAPTSKVPQAAMSLLQYKHAIQAEAARVLSMGMTGNIAHEHAVELGRIVGDLEKAPSVEALLAQVKTVKEITHAIRTLPMLPADAFEAQKMLSSRQEEPDHAKAKSMADEITGKDSEGVYTYKDGTTRRWKKTLNETGDKVVPIWLEDKKEK